VVFLLKSERAPHPRVSEIATITSRATRPRRLDRSSDCAEICDKDKDCLSSDYNTAACRDKCTDKIERCEACIKDNSCSGSVFKCSSDCVGIVP
jgi:hypothetical protein